MIGYTDNKTKGIRRNFALKSKRTKKNQMLRDGNQSLSILLKEYSKHCTLHGVHYVFRDDASFIERFVSIL